MIQPEVSNYITFSGPFGPLGHGLALPVTETYTQYILQVIEKFNVEDIKKRPVKRSVAEAFSKHSDLYMKQTAWSAPWSSLSAFINHIDCMLRKLFFEVHIYHGAFVLREKDGGCSSVADSSWHSACACNNSHFPFRRARRSRRDLSELADGDNDLLGN